MTSDLVVVEAELKKINEQMKVSLEEVEELKKQEAVRKYITIDNELAKIKAMRSILMEKQRKIIVKNCNHSLWYFLDDETDSYEQRQEWRCVCVECMTEEVEHSSYFSNRLIIQSASMGFGQRCLNSYDEVREEYYSLQNTGVPEEEIIKMMMERFNNQKSAKIITKADERSKI